MSVCMARWIVSGTLLILSIKYVSCIDETKSLPCLAAQPLLLFVDCRVPVLIQGKSLPHPCHLIAANDVYKNRLTYPPK